MSTSAVLQPNPSFKPTVHAFGAPVGASAHDAREDAIAVYGVGKIFAADVKVTVHSWDRRVGDQKAVAIAVRDDSAGN